MSISFGKSKQRSGTTTTQEVEPAQQEFLQRLRSGAVNLAEQQAPGLQNLFGTSNQLQQQTQGVLGQVGQVGQQAAQPGQGGFGQGQGGIEALQGLAAGTNPALQALSAQAFGNNPNLGAQIGQLGEDINLQLQRQLGGVGIAGQANQAGQLGGGRQGVESGLAQEAALRSFGRGATELRGQDIGRQLTAASQLAGFQGQAGQGLAGLGGQQVLGQQALDLQGLQTGGQLGLGVAEQLPQQFNLAQAPFGAQFSPLTAAAGVVGPPNTLTQSESFGRTDQFQAGINANEPASALFGLL